MFVVDTDSGKFFEADELLANEKDPIRHGEIFRLRLENRTQLMTGEARFVCPLCPGGPQPLSISGRIDGHFYFKHLGGSEECGVKSSKLTHDEIRCIKYNGQQRGALHEKMKEQVAQFLRLESDLDGEVAIEKRVTDYSVSKAWRQPDVRAKLNDVTFAFEIQVSTDFLDVLIARTLFYAKLGIRLVWVFPRFSDDLNEQRFAQKDIFYQNNSNAFVFDSEAREASEAEGRLVLKCLFKKYAVEDLHLVEDLDRAFVTLDMLQTSSDGASTFYHDAKRNREWCEAQILTGKQERKAERRRQVAQEVKAQREEELKRFDNNNPADWAHRYLQGLYRGRLDTWVGHSDPVGQLEERDHVMRLNDKLAFDGERIHVLGDAMMDGSKDNFLRYVFEAHNIRIATNKIRVQNRPVLEWCIGLAEGHRFKNYVSFLFKKGYRLTSDDRKLLDAMFVESSERMSDEQKNTMDRWGFVHIMSKVRWNMIDDARQSRVEYALFAVLSMKKGVVIGTGFNNLKEFVPNMLEYHSEHGELFINAMWRYKQIDRLSREDQKGTIGKRIAKFTVHKPTQSTTYNRIFFDVFPELEPSRPYE